ncbi:MAG: hypothetical protein KTR15_07905 [Phycisphaeraceae bacterium]|nr:hypothetical protein [Phycisphaeraceae bacterium]
MDSQSDLNELIKKFDDTCKDNPLCQLAFPPKVITTTTKWKELLGDSVATDADKNKFADTLTGCEALAWFIDRFKTFGAARSVPAKLLFHQILDVIDYFTKLRVKKGKFKPRLKKCLEGISDKNLEGKILELWEERHRSHLDAVGEQRDHRYGYFVSIRDAWCATVQLIDEFGGDFASYDGLLKTVAGREKARVDKVQRVADEFDI